MVALVAKLRHQLDVAHTLAKSHINFVVIPIIEDKDELPLVRLQVDRLEKLTEGKVPDD